MIDRTHPLSVVRQCQLLKLARSTAYYQATPVSDTALTLMRRLDELHRQYPFAGAGCYAISSGTTWSEWFEHIHIEASQLNGAQYLEITGEYAWKGKR